MFMLDLEKAEEPEIKMPTSFGSSEKQESSRKTSISALLTMSKPLAVWITTNWKILREMGMPDHLTCLLGNVYAGQEATVRTVHGITDWFQIGKVPSVHFSHSVMSYSLWSHGLQHIRPPCPSLTPEFTQNHVHWVGDAIQPSHPLSSSFSPAFNLSQHQSLFRWVSSMH